MRIIEVKNCPICGKDDIGLEFMHPCTDKRVAKVRCRCYSCEADGIETVGESADLPAYAGDSRGVDTDHLTLFLEIAVSHWNDTVLVRHKRVEE